MTPLPQHIALQRRKIHYVDKALQKWLLLALVLLETGLVAAMVWLMHWRLSQIIEENLYRVHLAKAAPMAHQLVQEAAVLLIIFILANVIALLIANGIWRRYLNALLRDFTTLIGRTGRLDFSTDAESSVQHRLLDLARSHRARERLRLAAIREQVALLDAELSGAGDARKLRELLNGLARLMPRMV